MKGSSGFFYGIEILAVLELYFYISYDKLSDLLGCDNLKGFYIGIFSFYKKTIMLMGSKSWIRSILLQV
jgi:hypothetical protein